MRATEALLLLAAVLGTVGDGDVNNGLSWSEQRGRGGETEVVSEVGGESELVCPGDWGQWGGVDVGSVSWVRVSPRLEVISGGHSLFSNSPRLRLTVSSPPALRLSPLLHEDEGVYECQLNTEPKRAWRYRLIVLKQTAPAPPYAAVEQSMQRDPPAAPHAPPSPSATAPLVPVPTLVLALLYHFWLLHGFPHLYNIW